MKKIIVKLFRILVPKRSKTEELLSDTEYLNLEEIAHRKFSEQSREYKNKLSGYAQGAESVLELGCGEGEFLLYLKDKFGKAITVTGVDNNEAMAGKTRSKNINCISKDALSALEALPNNSQNVIYALHIVEHLKSKYLRDVFNECFRCLKKQGCLVIETPNTQSLYVLSHYYFRDATHQIPRHPSLILYLLECTGFHETEIDFLDLPNEELIPVDHDLESLRRVAKRLNELMFSSGNNVLITAKKI